MFPFPSAMNDPIRVNGTTASVAWSQQTVPVIENAYCPCRLLFENRFGGGGGVVVEPPPPLQAPAHNAAAAQKKTLHPRFIAYLPRSNAPSPFQGASARAECPSRFAALPFDFPSV